MMCKSGTSSGSQTVALFGATLLSRGSGSEFIAAVVVGVVGVPFRPDPFCLVTGHLFIERFPQILVDDGFFSGRHPAFALPAVNPSSDAVLQIFGIGDDLHFAAFAEGVKALDGGGQLHAIVGRVGLAAPQLLFVVAIAENRRPPARTRIAEAGAIGNELYLFQCASTASEWKKASTRSRMAADSCAL